MTNKNVKNTCKGAGLVNTCTGSSTSCSGVQSGCTVTSLTSCYPPMGSDLSKVICGDDDARKCSILYDVFAYTPQWGWACGVDEKHLCKRGDQLHNKHALCAGKTYHNQYRVPQYIYIFIHTYCRFLLRVYHISIQDKQCCSVVSISSEGIPSSSRDHFGRYRRPSLDEPTYKREGGQ